MTIKLEQVKAETAQNDIFSKVLRYMNTHWPDKVEESIPYSIKKLELNTDVNCLFWEHWLKIAPNLKISVLKELFG